MFGVNKFGIDFNGDGDISMSEDLMTLNIINDAVDSKNNDNFSDELDEDIEDGF